jgi:diaminopimelate epimerase
MEGDMTAAHRSEDLVLIKLQGLGNDFLVLLDDQGEAAGSDPVATGTKAVPFQPSPDWARRVCDRHLGIGADGLIQSRRAPADEGWRLSFRLWNADGGEAEMSGNGLRCLAHAALDAGWVQPDEPFGVITPAGRREVSTRRGAEAGSTWASVDMGPVKVRGEEHRCNVGHGQLLVDVGNPHLVVIGPDPATVDVASLGPLLEETDPAGLNVEFVTLGPGPDSVTMRVWERGVGETQACGTGSCAAAAALHHWGRVGRAVTVYQPGGAAAVELRTDGTATLAGPSVHIATCVVPR